MIPKRIKEYLHSWDAPRIFRLSTAIVMFIAWYFAKEPMLGAFGGLLLVQAVFNLSCCAGGQCYTGTSAKPETQYDIKNLNEKADENKHV